MVANVKKIIRWLTPKLLIRQWHFLSGIVRLAWLYINDFREYVSYSSTFIPPEKNKEMLEARIIAHYHIIEKGLSLRDTRIGFGNEIIHTLLDLLESYIREFQCDNSFIYDCAVSALLKYVEFNEANMYPVEDIHRRLSKLTYNHCASGTISLSKAELLERAGGDFETFCYSRHSVRNFDDKEVSKEDLMKAIELAQTAPSVCNRQTSRVYVISSKSAVKEVLQLQGGSRGFEDFVDKVIVITSNLHAFQGNQERNQSFIDGGLYAMNLLYGLHYVGIGACPLIWCSAKECDRCMRRLLGIPKNERIIMLIATGTIPDTLVVAESKRFPVQSVCTFVKE